MRLRYDGTHIHYVYANTTDESGKVHTMTTDYVLPPLSANETYEIKYEYTFDKDGMTGEYDQLTNTFTAQSGGKWDHSQNSSNSNPTDVQIKSCKRAAGTTAMRVAFSGRSPSTKTVSISRIRR